MSSVIRSFKVETELCSNLKIISLGYVNYTDWDALSCLLIIEA